MTISFNTLGEFGRLGNQMFQYAFLLGLHSKYGYDIAIPPSNFKNAWFISINLLLSCRKV